MEVTEFVTHLQWQSYAKRIERANLKESGTSLTFTGIARRASRFIVEIWDDEGGMIVRKGWRNAMREPS